MVRLPKTDQRWILRQLSKEQYLAFEEKQGLRLLEEAQRFKHIHIRDLPSTPCMNHIKPETELPLFCEELATQTPLFIAIIIEQGNYPWADLFLNQYDSKNLIKKMLEDKVPELKPVVKSHLFQEWMQNPSFDSYLETEHG